MNRFEQLVSELLLRFAEGNLQSLEAKIELTQMAKFALKGQQDLKKIQEGNWTPPRPAKEPKIFDGFDEKDIKIISRELKKEKPILRPVVQLNKIG